MNIDITEKELHFLVALAKQGADRMSSRICDDLEGEPDAIFETFTTDEKDAMMKGYHHWNGDPEEWEPGWWGLGAGMWLSYLVARLEGKGRASRAPLPNADETGGLAHLRPVFDRTALAFPEAESIAVSLEFQISKAGDETEEVVTLLVSAVRSDERQTWRVAKERATRQQLEGLRLPWLSFALEQAIEQVQKDPWKMNRYADDRITTTT